MVTVSTQQPAPSENVSKFKIKVRTSHIQEFAEIRYKTLGVFAIQPVGFLPEVLWCSLECTPPCQGGGREFKSRQDRFTQSKLNEA